MVSVEMYRKKVKLWGRVLQDSYTILHRFHKISWSGISTWKVLSTFRSVFWVGLFPIGHGYLLLVLSLRADA